MKRLIVILIPFFSVIAFSQTSVVNMDSVVIKLSSGDYIRKVTPVTYQVGSPTDSILVRNAATKKRGLLSPLALPLSTASINALALKSDANHTHTFASLTSKPTTILGFGITDAAALNHNHAGIYSPVAHTHIYADISNPPTIPNTAAQVGAEPTITVLPFSKGGIGGGVNTSATTGAMTVVMNTEIVFITPTGACTFNASGGVAGQRVTFVITTSGASSFVLTWGANFKSIGTLATGTTAAKKFTVSFLNIDNTTWVETGRTTAM